MSPPLPKKGIRGDLEPAENKSPSIPPFFKGESQSLATVELALLRGEMEHWSLGFNPSLTSISRTQKEWYIFYMNTNSAKTVGLSRRQLLGALGGAAFAFLGFGRAQRGPREGIGGLATVAAATLPSCVVRPQQTEGPFFVEEKLNRSDIRSDLSDGSFKQGVPLRLAFQVSRVEGSACAPLSGAIVDIWQCDALGAYSDVRDMSRDTRGNKFLRGYQVTNAGGIAEFLTIYPGWYQGRTVHIHFKIRTEAASKRAYEFTSQLYFDETITDQVHKQTPYNSKGQRTTTNSTDSLFRRGGRELTLPLIGDVQGYTTKFDIGLQLT